ncbi:MAG: Uma2 family endonuclease [Nostocaceae cyanobacterium]|nr:Uma2 family endonuclease [Nostocaceae cyanobacterium]
MTITSAPIDTQPLLLDVSNTTLIVTPEQFDRLCIDNPDLRLELTQNRELIVMSPTGGESGRRNGNLFARVWNWNDQTKLGDVFDSSTGYDFTVIGGGKPSPDVSWIEKSRLDGIDIKGFIPVVPDFVIELRSSTDRLNDVQTKMSNYQTLGVKLGILVNPQNRTVEIYRLGQEIQVLESPMSISCEDVMPGFILSMNEIW